MLKVLNKVLDIIGTGVIIIDEEHKIMFFNSAVEKLCNIPEKEAVGKSIYEVCPVFGQEMYKSIIDNVFKTGQSRFCSSAIHKSFVFPKGEKRESRRQNMKIDYLSVNAKEYAVIQITDITDIHKNELSLHEHIKTLKTGYRDLQFSKKVTEKLAKYDTLTGLLNRFYFEVEYNEMLKTIKEEADKVAVMFVDLDCFKQVNDNYGHTVGDALLQQAAARMKNNATKPDLIMRMGGDEFVVACKDNVYGKTFEGIANSMLIALGKPYYIDDVVMNISASIGISIYPDDSKQLPELINKADKAMYASKQSGRNRVTFFYEIQK
ncbi:MAG: putative diguanylate cyclase YegE [Firmicutes bacterium ADurb.Bin193]|nr:MAG: putative diguanylate cyclase YegE [Firmicutes bacterium ADurb.Bin193]